VPSWREASGRWWGAWSGEEPAGVAVVVVVVVVTTATIQRCKEVAPTLR